MHKNIKILTIIFLSAYLTACAGFRGGELGDIGNWPPTKQRSIKLGYVMTGKVDFNGNVNSASPQFIQVWQETAERAFNDSGLFDAVIQGYNGADIRAEIDVVDVGEGSMALAMLSGFTFTVIPSTAKDTFVVKATFKDRQGNVLGTVERSESVRMWIHITLLPLTPFKFPFTVAKDAQYDIYRAILVEAKAKRIF